MNGLFLLPLLFFMYSAISRGAELEKLTLTRAVGEALEQSPDVLQAKADTDITSWNRLEAISAHLPHLSVNGEHIFSAEYMNLGVLFGGSQVIFPTAFPQTSIALDASILIFDGFGSINRYRASKLEDQASTLRFSRVKFLIEKEIRLRFYQVLASQVLLDVADQNIKSLKEHLSIAQAMQRSGYSTRFDSLRIEALLEEAQAERILAADNEVIARRALSRSMAITDDTRQLEGSLPVPDRNIIGADLSLDVSKRTDLEAAQKHEEAVDKMSQAASRFWIPKLSLFAQKLFYKFGDFDPAILPNSSFQNAYSVGLRLTWNIFDGGSSLAKSGIANAQEEKEKQVTRAAFLNAPEEFETWKRRFIYNSSLYEARLKTVAKSEESVRLAKAEIKAGTRTNTELLDAELELFRARAGLVRAQADAAEAFLRLELALGRSITGGI